MSDMMNGAPAHIWAEVYARPKCPLCGGTGAPAAGGGAGGPATLRSGVYVEGGLTFYADENGATLIPARPQEGKK